MFHVLRFQSEDTGLINNSFICKRTIRSGIIISNNKNEAFS